MRLLWILSLLASAASIPQSQEEIPSWVNICNGTYLFSEDAKSWTEACGECMLYGAHIAQIDSLAENFCLLDYGHTEEFGGNLTKRYSHGPRGGVAQLMNQTEGKNRIVLMFVSKRISGPANG